MRVRFIAATLCLLALLVLGCGRSQPASPAPVAPPASLTPVATHPPAFGSRPVATPTPAPPPR